MGCGASCLCLLCLLIALSVQVLAEDGAIEDVLICLSAWQGWVSDSRLQPTAWNKFRSESRRCCQSTRPRCISCACCMRRICCKLSESIRAFLPRPARSLCPRSSRNLPRFLRLRRREPAMSRPTPHRRPRQLPQPRRCGHVPRQLPRLQRTQLQLQVFPLRSSRSCRRRRFLSA